MRSQVLAYTIHDILLLRNDRRGKRTKTQESDERRLVQQAKYTNENVSELEDASMHAIKPSKARILATEFTTKIYSRAEGSFRWVKLVLDELLTEFTGGETLQVLIKKL